MAPPHLLGFAQEIFDNICGFLPSTRDLKNLRLVSRLSFDMTTPVYIEKQFSEIEVDLSQERLQYLLKVSRSSKFSGFVRTIIIEPRDVIPDNARYLSPNMADVRGRQAFRQQGRDARMLAQALSNFQSLQGIGLAHYVDSRRFEKNLLIPSNGFGFLPWCRQSDSALSYAFSVLDRALQLSPNTPLPTLRAGGRPKNAAQRSSIGHLTLQTLAVGFPGSYSSIKNLHLVLEITPGSYGVHCEEYLASFLEQTPNLESLRLELWASSAEWLSETLMNITFPQLESLHLEAVRFIRASQLKAFVSRHAETLHNIALVNVTFTDDNLVTTFPTIFAAATLTDSPASTDPATSTASPTSMNPPTSTSPPDLTDPLTAKIPDLHPELHLKSLRLQQIASLRDGLLLFDSAGVETVCDHCMSDLQANWAFKKGQLCNHGNFKVEGELDTGRKLRAQLAGMSLLPYTLLGRLYPGSDDGVVESKAVVSDVAASTDDKDDEADNLV